MSNEDNGYWAKYIGSAILIAVATALATETSKVVADKLRERWGMKKDESK